MIGKKRHQGTPAGLVRPLSWALWKEVSSALHTGGNRWSRFGSSLCLIWKASDQISVWYPVFTRGKEGRGGRDGKRAGKLERRKRDGGRNDFIKWNLFDSYLSSKQALPGRKGGWGSCDQKCISTTRMSRTWVTLGMSLNLCCPQTSRKGIINHKGPDQLIFICSTLWLLVPLENSSLVLDWASFIRKLWHLS